MVANITHHKTNQPEKLKQLAAVAEKAQAVKDKLLAAVDEDTAAFNAYLEALRLPANTAEEKQLRTEKMQAGLVAAVNVPYQTAVLSFEAMQIAREMALHGLAASLTDAAVGCEMAFAGVRGGIWNVLTNLPQITDRRFVEEKRGHCAQLLEDARKLLDQTAEAVDRKLAERIGRLTGRLCFGRTLPAAQLVNRLDQGDGVFRRGLRQDAVAEVENVAGAAGGLAEDFFRPMADFQRLGQ